MTQSTFLIEDFSKGLDFVSSANRIPVGYTPNALNFRIADYGGIEKVLGYSAFATAAANVHELSTYVKRDGSVNVLVTAQPTAWQTINSAGTATNIRTGMNATTQTTFVVHEEILYGLDPKNTIGAWTGTGSATAYAAGANTGPNPGIILGVWQNRLWTAKANANGDLTLRVEWSEPPGANGFVNNTGQWPATNYVELGGTGQTERIVGGIPTNDGLLVFTTGSTFLIYDTDGKHRIVDGQRGCVSRKSLARIGDNIYGITTDGVFSTNGTFPLEIISSRVDPLFRAEKPTLTQAAGIRWGNSYLASLQRSLAYNDLTLDLTTSEDGVAVMANQYPAYAWVKSDLVSGKERAYFVDASDRTKIRRAFNGGTFNGAAIQCYYELPFDPFGDEEHLKRLQRLRLVGRGDVYVAVKTDYRQDNLNAKRLSFPSIAGTGFWDTAVWDATYWADYALFEGWARPSARARRFSLRFYESSSVTAVPRGALGVTVADGSVELGGAGIYLIEPHVSASSRVR